MNKLTAELHAFMNSLMDRVDPAVADILRRNYDELERSGIAERAIRLGDKAPDFTLLDQRGKSFSLSDALRRGPVVALFVRGGWCPFCSITLRAFDNVRVALERAGASLVAISPATPVNVEATAERDVLHYSMLSDPSLVVASSYGLVWEPNAELQSVYARLGHDIPRINGTGDWRLPIPAGYVIGIDGIIHAARVDSRLTERMLPTEALGEVRSLSNVPVA